MLQKSTSHIFILKKCYSSFSKKKQVEQIWESKLLSRISEKKGIEMLSTLKRLTIVTLLVGCLLRNVITRRVSSFNWKLNRAIRRIESLNDRRKLQRRNNQTHLQFFFVFFILFFIKKQKKSFIFQLRSKYWNRLSLGRVMKHRFCRMYIKFMYDVHTFRKTTEWYFTGSCIAPE